MLFIIHLYTSPIGHGHNIIMTWNATLRVKEYYYDIIIIVFDKIAIFYE